MMAYEYDGAEDVSRVLAESRADETLSKCSVQDGNNNRDDSYANCIQEELFHMVMPHVYHIR